jgi:16S rRNA (guanine966-N2)-methyltransferase
MRIISGERRGHKIDPSATKDTRPTSDLVREAIFNILGAGIEDVLTIDLFAGTGALGLEALSRGARRAIFVEVHRENANLIRRNVATLRYEDRAVVLTADVFRWARSIDLGEEGPCVVFIDPPYAEYRNHPRRMTDLMTRLVESLPAGSLLVVESSKHVDMAIFPDPERWDRRRHGGTAIAIREVDQVDESPPKEAATDGLEA